MQARRLWVPLILVVVGLVLIVVGWGEANSDDVRCGGQRMNPGDECEHIDVDTGSSYTNTYEHEQRSQHGTGRLMMAAGAVILLGSGFLLYWRTARVARTRSLIARRRAALATAQGWTYQAEDPALLRTWQTGPLSQVTERPACNVLSGTANGRQFQLFDFEKQQRFSGTRMMLTACVVPLRAELPAFRVIMTQQEAWMVACPHVSFHEVDLEGIDWAYAVRTTAPQVARRLLTPEVIAHIREHRLSFAVHGRWVSVIWRSKRDQSRVAPMVAAATQLVSLWLLPAGARG